MMNVDYGIMSYMENAPVLCGDGDFMDKIKTQLTILAHVVSYPDRAREIVQRSAISAEMFADEECRAAFIALMEETSEDEEVLLNIAMERISLLRADGMAAARFLAFAANPGAIEYDTVQFAAAAIMRERRELLADAAVRSVGLPPDVVLDREMDIILSAKTKIDALYAAFPTFRSGSNVAASAAVVDDDTPATDPKLLDMPGFVNELTEYSMRAAPRPNRVLSFTGALAILAHLSGRKFIGPRDARPNLYLVALAGSGVGKDFPQRLNRTIAQLERMEVSVIGSAASGQGLEDALVRSPTLLCQVDEFDTVLETLKDTKGAKQATEALWQMLLTLFSASGSVHTTRIKAAGARGSESGAAVYQPSVSLYTSAIPSRFYKALSERACTNGLIGRCLVFEAGKRGEANLNSGETVNAIPYNLRRMISFLANTGLRFNDNRPVDARDLVKVPYGEGAAAEMLKITNEVDTLFNKASSHQDEMRMSIWNRSGELVGKLSLLYAISESLDGTEPPVISVKAVRWAWRLVKSLQLRMIAMVEEYSAIDDMDEKVKKVERLIRQAGKRGISRKELGRKTHFMSDVLDKIEETLIDRGVITVSTLPSSKNGKTSKLYIIVRGK